MAQLDGTAPIEVWLKQDNLEVTCRVAHEDESTSTLTVDSLSMRGAQREITGWLISHGYEPAGRWQDQWADSIRGYHAETSRLFRPAKVKPAAAEKP
jgi:hypothetical protein